jgi:hypothetical protein
MRIHVVEARSTRRAGQAMPGRADTSVRREHDRRRAADERSVRSRQHPELGGLIAVVRCRSRVFPRERTSARGRSGSGIANCVLAVVRCLPGLVWAPEGVILSLGIRGPSTWAVGTIIMEDEVCVTGGVGGSPAK